MDFSKLAQAYREAFRLIRPSTRALIRNLYAVFYLFAVPLMIFVCGGVLIAAPQRGTYKLFLIILGWIVIAASVVIAFIASAAMPYVQLQSIRKQTVSYSEAMRAGRRIAWRMTGLYLIIGSLIVLGVICFIIPGIYLYKRYLYAPYILQAKDTGILEALRGSAELSRRYNLPTWTVASIIALYSIVSLLTVVGALVGGVLRLLYAYAPAIRYDEVVEQETKRLHTKKKRGKKTSKRRAAIKK